MGKQRRTRPRPQAAGSQSSSDDAARAGAAAAPAPALLAAAGSTSSGQEREDDDTSTTGPRSSSSASSSSSSASSSVHGVGAEADPSASPPRTPIAFWPALIPGALFCFQLFGFNPVLGQFLNQVRRTRSVGGSVGPVQKCRQRPRCGEIQMIRIRASSILNPNTRSSSATGWVPRTATPPKSTRPRSCS